MDHGRRRMKQASKQTNKQADKQASKQADKLANQYDVKRFKKLTSKYYLYADNTKHQTWSSSSVSSYRIETFFVSWSRNCLFPFSISFFLFPFPFFPILALLGTICVFRYRKLSWMVAWLLGPLFSTWSNPSWYLIDELFEWEQKSRVIRFIRFIIGISSFGIRRNWD